MITYRKGRYRDWQRRCFTEVTVDVAKVTSGSRVAKGACARSENGHQTSVVTTRRDLSIETVALRMNSRGQQENFFR